MSILIASAAFAVTAMAGNSQAAVAFSPDATPVKVANLERYIGNLSLPKRAEARAVPANGGSRWPIWAGAAIGAALMLRDVHDESDLVFTGKLMWVGIGAGIGAGAGWLAAKIADAH